MSLVSFKPKNHPHQMFDDPHGAKLVTRGADDATDDRRTPPSIYDPLHAQHGFTLDAAASAENARCARFFDLEADGLSQPWTDEIVWCNPPYSDLGSWVKKARYEVEHGCRKVVMLLPANRTEQRWWQDEVEPYRDRGLGMTTRNLPGRPRFGTRENPEGRHGRGLTMKRENGKCVTSSPFGCVVLVIEPRDES